MHDEVTPIKNSPTVVEQAFSLAESGENDEQRLSAGVFADMIKARDGGLASRSAENPLYSTVLRASYAVAGLDGTSLSSGGPAHIDFSQSFDQAPTKNTRIAKAPPETLDDSQYERAGFKQRPKEVTAIGKHTRIEWTDGVPRLLPNENSSWHYQLQGKVDFSQRRDAFSVDLYNTSKADVQKMQENGSYAIAYINAGAWQPDKPDSHKYPRDVIGKTPMQGWPQERWLDIRNIETLRPIIREKLQLAKEKGFNAVEPDNVDGYSNAAARKDFGLKASDQLRFNRMIAQEAHKMGLAIFLKNTDGLAKELARDFDGAIVESAFKYNEASNYKPFRDAGKTVFAVEYGPLTKGNKQEAARLGFNVITAQRALNGSTRLISP